jgi:hypothetical protein
MRKRVRQAEADAGQRRDLLSSSERERLGELVWLILGRPTFICSAGGVSFQTLKSSRGRAEWDRAFRSPDWLPITTSEEGGHSAKGAACPPHGINRP